MSGEKLNLVQECDKNTIFNETFANNFPQTLTYVI